MSQGCFIVLEGIDGSGTTTQARLLATHFEAEGRGCLLTREPSQGPVGVFLRSALEKRLSDHGGQPTQLDWQTMALLFAADRVDHCEREIDPALEAGQIVVSDRYALSSLTYQSATSPMGDATLPWLAEINRRARRPDLTIVLDVDPQVAAERRARRGGARELYELDELQRRLARLYRRAPELLVDQRTVLLDGEGAERAVAQRILGAIADWLDSPGGARR